MIKVYQTIPEPPHGNCFSACIASVLELHIESVPNYVIDDCWQAQYRDWAYEHNMALMTFPLGEDKANMAWFDSLNIVGIAAVTEPDMTWLHAVVMRGTRLLHDPMPTHLRQWNQSVGSVADYTVLSPLDPSRPIAVPNDRRFAHFHEPLDQLTTRRGKLLVNR